MIYKFYNLNGIYCLLCFLLPITMALPFDNNSNYNYYYDFFRSNSLLNNNNNKNNNENLVRYTDSVLVIPIDRKISKSPFKKLKTFELNGPELIKYISLNDIVGTIIENSELKELANELGQIRMVDMYRLIFPRGIIYSVNKNILKRFGFPPITLTPIPPQILTDPQESGDIYDKIEYDENVYQIDEDLREDINTDDYVYDQLIYDDELGGIATTSATTATTVIGINSLNEASDETDGKTTEMIETTEVAITSSETSNAIDKKKLSESDESRTLKYTMLNETSTIKPIEDTKPIVYKEAGVIIRELIQNVVG